MTPPYEVRSNIFPKRSDPYEDLVHERRGK